MNPLLIVVLVAHSVVLVLVGFLAGRSRERSHTAVTVQVMARRVQDAEHAAAIRRIVEHAWSGSSRMPQESRGESR